MSRLAFIPQHMVDLPQVGMQRALADGTVSNFAPTANDRGLYDANLPGFETGGITQYAPQGLAKAVYDFGSWYDDEEFWGVDQSAANASVNVGGSSFIIRSKFNSSGVLTELGRYDPGKALSAASMPNATWLGAGVAASVIRISATTLMVFARFQNVDGSLSAFGVGRFTWNGSSFAFTQYQGDIVVSSLTHSIGSGQTTSSAAAVFCYGDGSTVQSAFQAKSGVTSISTQTVGSTTTSVNIHSLYRVSDTLFLALYHNAGVKMLAFAATPSANNLTIGAAFSSAETTATLAASNLCAVVLNQNRFVLYDNVSKNLYLYDIGGGGRFTPTLLSTTPFPGTQISPTRMKCMVRLNDTEFLIAFNDGTTEYAQRVLLNADGALTLRSLVTLTSPTFANTTPPLEPENRGLVMPGNRVLLVNRAPSTVAPTPQGEQVIRLLKAA